MASNENRANGAPSSRAPVSNPARRLARVAVGMARLELNGAGGNGRVAASPPAPSSATLLHTDGSEITAFIVGLDYTDSEHELIMD